MGTTQYIDPITWVLATRKKISNEISNTDILDFDRIKELRDINCTIHAALHYGIEKANQLIAECEPKLIDLGIN